MVSENPCTLDNTQAKQEKKTETRVESVNFIPRVPNQGRKYPTINLGTFFFPLNNPLSDHLHYINT